MSARLNPARRRRGFTLMEVLLVLVIIVILAGAVVIPLSQTQTKALAKTAKIYISNLENNIKAYHLDLNNYPTSLEALVQAPGDLPNPARWGGPYVDKAVVLPDPWDRPYQYAYPGQRNPGGFDLWSVGPDGVSGSEDDIGNWN